MTRLATVVLAAMLASTSLVPCRAEVAPMPAASKHTAGMEAPPGPLVSAAVAPAAVVLEGSPSVLPNGAAAARLAFGERPPERAVRASFVVKSAPTILRV
jgi:hypothetical protein